MKSFFHDFRVFCLSGFRHVSGFCVFLQSLYFSVGAIFGLKSDTKYQALYDVGSNFFGTNKLLFVPNATFGLKAVLDGILDSSQVVPNGGLSGLHTVAYLAPLYGATKRLLK